MQNLCKIHVKSCQRKQETEQETKISKIKRKDGNPGGFML